VEQAQVDSAVRLEEAETSKINHSLDAAAKMAEVREREHSMVLKTHQAHLSHAEMRHKLAPKEGEEYDED
jgi:hypothetical protein